MSRSIILLSNYKFIASGRCAEKFYRNKYNVVSRVAQSAKTSINHFDAFIRDLCVRKRTRVIDDRKTISATKKTTPLHESSRQVRIIYAHFLTQSSAPKSAKKIEGFIEDFLQPTGGYVDKIFAGGPVHFDVSIAHKMPVPLQCHFSLLGSFEANQRFAVPTSLLTKAQGDATSANVKVLKTS